MKVLGLTGGIGSGKTTVAGFFKDLGIPVYIADDEAKRLMETSAEVRQQIIALFGSQAYLENIPDRKYIASQVFKDSEKLEELNGIIHPAVALDFEAWKQRQQAPYVVYEAAILFEKGGHKKCDFTLLVTAPFSEKIKRLQKRDQSSLEEIEARMNNQWSDEKKAALASFIIENTDLQKTQKLVEQLHENLLNSA